jgi:tetratricopeptide (TPR) repeat protein
MVMLLARGAALRADTPAPDVDPKNIIEQFDMGGYDEAPLRFVPGIFRRVVESVAGLFYAEPGILLPVKLKGEEYLFLLDTGTVDTIFDLSLPLGKPKKKARSSSRNQGLDYQFFDAPKATLGRLDLGTVGAVVGVDLTHLREVAGDDIYGVIGMDFLKRYVIRYDPDGGIVSFLSSAGPDAGRPFRLFQHPDWTSDTWVVAELPGWGPELFLIDTGAESSVLLRNELFAALEKRGKVSPLGKRMAWTFYGIHHSRTGLLKEIRVGVFVERQISVGESGRSFNFLGLRFLKRYVVTFDFPHQTMYLKRGKHGKELQQSPARGILTSIRRTEPAQQLGPQAGDGASHFWNRGIAFASLRQFDKALADFDEAIRLDPNDPKTYAFRGDLLSSRGNIDRAIADYSHAIRLAPANPDSYFRRAEVYRIARNGSAALADINECIRLAPDLAKPRLARGNIHLLQSDCSAAIQDAEAAIQIRPGDARAYILKGCAYSGLHDYSRAVENHSQAVRLDPGNAWAYAQRGMARLELKEMDQSIADLNRAIRLEPDYGKFFSWRGFAYETKKDYAKAIADFRQTVQLSPKDAYGYKSLSRLLASCPDAKLRNGKKAWEYAKTATELTNQEDPNALEALAAAFAECRDYKQAVHWQEKVLEFPDYMEKNGKEVRERLQLYEARKPYRLP